MDNNIFSTIIKNINAVKYFHFRANNLGRRLSLLAAILIFVYLLYPLYSIIITDLVGRELIFLITKCGRRIISMEFHIYYKLHLSPKEWLLQRSVNVWLYYSSNVDILLI